MSLGIQQEASYAGDGLWRWSVWLDGPDAELDGVESVEWVLHPTFPNPIVLVRQRQTRFRLDSSGWGAFEINAHVQTKAGTHQHLKHWLRLEEEPDRDSAAAPPAEERPAVFVSAGVRDAAWEEAVRDALTRRDLVVLTASDLPGGVPAEAAISSTLDKADMVVGIFSDKSGPWAEREVTAAVEKDLSVVPLVVGPHAKVPAHLQAVRAVRVERLDEVDAAIGQIVDRLR
jgi:TIR domain/YEATS family